MTVQQDAIDVTDALKGGPNTCPHCKEEMEIIILKTITTEVEPGLYWNSITGYRRMKGGPSRKRIYVCCHCGGNVQQDAQDIMNKIKAEDDDIFIERRMKQGHFEKLKRDLEKVKKEAQKPSWFWAGQTR